MHEFYFDILCFTYVDHGHDQDEFYGRFETTPEFTHTKQGE
jgi:hypothetical protein